MHFLALQHQYCNVTCAESMKYCQLYGKTILVLGNILRVFSSYKREKSNQINSFYMILQILVYPNKNKMAKYLQWKIMCGVTTCKVDKK